MTRPHEVGDGPRRNIDESGYFRELLQRGVRVHHTARLPHFRSESPVEIRPNVLAEGPLSIGAYSYISEGTRLSVPTTIGRYCSIAHNCDIGGTEHPTNWATTHPFPWGTLPLDHWPAMREVKKRPFNGIEPIAIGHDVWIGTRAFIRNGVTIGTGAVIGAHAVVTRTVPPYAIVAGNPGRIIRYRFPPEIVARLLASQWWTRDMASLGTLPIVDVEAFLAQLGG